MYFFKIHCLFFITVHKATLFKSAQIKSELEKSGFCKGAEIGKSDQDVIIILGTTRRACEELKSRDVTQVLEIPVCCWCVLDELLKVWSLVAHTDN